MTWSLVHDLAMEIGGDLFGSAAAADVASRRRQSERRSARPPSCLVPFGKLIDTCFRLRTASRGSGVRILRVSCTAMIEKPPGTGIGLLMEPAGMPPKCVGRAASEAVPGGPSRGRRRPPRSMLRNIAGHSPRTRRRCRSCVEDLVRIVERLRFGGGRRRQEDFADAIFFGALRRVHAVENCLDLIVADADAAFDLGALQPLPGDLAFDLASQRLDVRAVRLEHRGKLRPACCFALAATRWRSGRCPTS